jgi:hypothetical protein
LIDADSIKKAKHVFEARCVIERETTEVVTPTILTLVSSPDGDRP